MLHTALDKITSGTEGWMKVASAQQAQLRSGIPRHLSLYCKRAIDCKLAMNMSVACAYRTVNQACLLNKCGPEYYRGDRNASGMASLHYMARIIHSKRHQPPGVESNMFAPATSALAA